MWSDSVTIWNITLTFNVSQHKNVTNLQLKKKINNIIRKNQFQLCKTKTNFLLIYFSIIYILATFIVQWSRLICCCWWRLLLIELSFFESNFQLLWDTLSLYDDAKSFIIKNNILYWQELFLICRMKLIRIWFISVYIITYQIELLLL